MLTPVSVLAVIPARFGSTRFPGKPLALLRSVPIIVWVHRAVKRAKLVDRVLVATDNTDIANEIRKQGGLAYLTSPHCSCGTIRVVEAVKLFYEREPQDWNRLSVIVNVQGDEPAVNPEHIDIAIESLLKDKDETNLQVSTLATPIQSIEEWSNPNHVKVVCNSKHEAMYFSRSPIPYKDANIAFPHPFYLRHVGIYAFRKSFLEMMPQLSTSPLEALERLEQLTWLYHQKKILVNVVQHAWRGIDRPEDLIFLEKHLPIQRNQE
ncbi:3-deoxy-manno-octulosonate cytidylyltransferase (CMP-KDO synthetase) [Galdieria sulphuraria]|uniref:3-deoxy-manno-octulosonate cytidylyltransferase (CMP-KDO synthetase) n=1 Tax=Galdieria sulphuraria TaxID=130081 RepID=M2W1E4_GALSU|nr:3-deoxy-manno-octulosonate cytidylyltransferase (CMP-KDO synthetase) [Galdieria sulphuraria]EME29481.1 3-deoxy-manno-octulosonate cytidylyltransferase (CMP-KDO synthetase) [Galdieria sulphuraria]|eukprot:XP_005706001.1 3-deoxy-manno-octulosonate cytidylyltransferase (CMP-KDO synthetase) [Galdieria sulphuraria]